MYSQDDVVLVPFPFTDQSGGTKRPALVISGSRMNKTADVILVQITKVQHTDSYSVPITAVDLTNPLRFVSEIRCNKILVAEQSLIIDQISRVSQSIINQVIDKINEIFEP
jgi:mRNA interferase MazF